MFTFLSSFQGLTRIDLFELAIYILKSQLRLVSESLASLAQLKLLTSINIIICKQTRVAMLFRNNSTSNMIELAWKPSAISIALRVLLIPNSTGYSCYHSLEVGQLFLNSLAQ